MLANAEPWLPNGDLERLRGSRFTDVRYVVETGSTNADLLAAARDGLRGPTVLVTGHQTAGRGRQDRAWFDAPGNSLLVSVLLTAATDWADLVPLAAGLAAVRAVDALSVSSLDSLAADRDAVDAVALKWPNDVIVPSLAERKLAGILVESTTVAGGLAVVIGMGLNLKWSAEPPPDVAERAATLEGLMGQAWPGSTPADIGRNLLGRYLVALDAALTVLAGSGGRSTTIGDYRHRCVTVGRDVSLDTPTGPITGRAVGIGDGGELLVETSDGSIRPMTAGDAHHRRP